MGFAMLLALPAMLFVGTLFDVATADDSPAPDESPQAEDIAHGNLLEDEAA
jgi:hypothetical protein